MKAEDLAGTWSLETWTQEFDDGRVAHPMGEFPIGQLTYTPSGRMCGIISARGRGNFATETQWQASTEERASAYDSFLAYAGDYSVEGSDVVHRVEISLYPNWVGTEQRRAVTMRGNELQLTGRIDEGTAEARTVRLSWTRMA